MESTRIKPGHEVPWGNPSFSRAFSACEFSAFCLAGKANHIEQKHVLEDFRKYLHEGSVPDYVTDSIRWNIAPREKSYA